MSNVIKEIEAVKLNMNPTDVLIVSIKTEDLLDHATVEGIRNNFKQKFPDNDILVFAMQQSDSIEFSVVSEQEAATLNAQENNTEEKTEAQTQDPIATT